MKVVILAGGFGTRLAEETVAVPKPMVQIGQHPILWHIMKFYASYGFEEFVVALGYKADVVKNFFLQFADMASDLTIDLGTGVVKRRRHHEETWKIHLIDTGRDTLTGGRLRRLAPLIKGATFMLTYGDGVAVVMEPGVLDYLTKDEDVLEIDLMERLTHDGQLAAYRHEGFWQCMDTLRDKHG